MRREVGKAKDESTTTLLLDDLMKTTCVNYVHHIIFISSICTVAYITNERENYFSVNSFHQRGSTNASRIILFLSHHKQFHDINANKHTSTPRSIISPYYTIVRTKLYVLYKTLCAQNTFVI